MDLDAAPYGGARYPIECRMDGRIFARFHLDVGIGDVVMQPLETNSRPRLARVAGISPAAMRLIPREQQAAEKLSSDLENGFAEMRAFFDPLLRSTK